MDAASPAVGIDTPMYAMPAIRASDDKTIFYQNPEGRTFVDECFDLKAPRVTSIEGLMESLRTYGPLICDSGVHASRMDRPVVEKKAKAYGEPVYGWHSHANVSFGGKSAHVMVVGATKTEKTAFVYFRMAKDVTKTKKEGSAFQPVPGALHFRIGFTGDESDEQLIRAYQIDPKDSRLYVVRYEKFKSYLVQADPIVPYSNFLYTQIVLRGAPADQKAKVNAIGQAIFDATKASAMHNGEQRASKIAYDTIVRIVDGARDHAEAGTARTIESNFDQVGDKHNMFLG